MPPTFGASRKMSLSAWVKTTTDDNSVIFETGYGSGHLVSLKRLSATDNFKWIVFRGSQVR